MKYSYVSLLRLTAKDSVRKEVSSCSESADLLQHNCNKVIKVIGRTIESISVIVRNYDLFGNNFAQPHIKPGREQPHKISTWKLSKFTLYDFSTLGVFT
jgi:hypothetical protein